MHPHLHRIPELIQEAISSADNINYEWDYKNLEWPIDENSIVWEVGSYRGRWALQVCRKYNPCMFCFEPQAWAWDVTRNVLEDFKATCLNYALGIESGIFPMSHHETDACSFVYGVEGATANMREISEVKSELGCDIIDLMLLNIEGYEYKLIPHMFGCGIYPRYLSVQFHKYTSEMVGKYIPTRDMIAERYDLLWDYGMTLSGWELRND